MKAMEFDDLRKIWDTQNNEPLYVIDEKALHNQFRAKMKTVHHITNMNEWSLILFNFAAGGILIGLNSLKPGANIFLLVQSAWMFTTVAYIVVSRIRRVMAGRQFERSIHGELDHAISVANYQVRLSQLVLWNLLPTGAIMILTGWEARKLLAVSAVMLGSSILAIYVGRKGLRVYKRRKRELETLKEKLESGI